MGLAVGGAAVCAYPDAGLNLLIQFLNLPITQKKKTAAKNAENL
jgi:hypothetical protein